MLSEVPGILLMLANAVSPSHIPNKPVCHGELERVKQNVAFASYRRSHGIHASSARDGASDLGGKWDWFASPQPFVLCFGRALREGVCGNSGNVCRSELFREI